MKINLKTDIGPLREKADQLLKRATIELLNARHAQLAPLYAVKLAEAEAVIAGRGIDADSTLGDEARSRGLDIRSLARLIVDAAAADRHVIRSIERDRLDKKNIIRNGTARDVRLLIEELEAGDRQRREPARLAINT